MPPDDASFAVLVHKVDSMHADFGEMRAVLRDLTNAINKLALVEERQTQFAIAQERAFKVLEKVEARIDAMESRIGSLESAEPMQRQTSTWVMAAVWAAAGLAVVLLLAKVGIKP